MVDVPGIKVNVVLITFWKGLFSLKEILKRYFASLSEKGEEEYS